MGIYQFRLNCLKIPICPSFKKVADETMHIAIENFKGRSGEFHKIGQRSLRGILSGSPERFLDESEAFVPGFAL